MTETDISNDEVVDLFNQIEAEEGSKGPKGEKAEVVRSLIRQAVTAVKPASGEISLTTLRKYCHTVLIKRAVKAGIPEDEARHGRKTGELDAEGKEIIDTTNMVRLDQSYFAGVVNSTWRTRKDEVTKAVIVVVNEELPPKVREPRKPGKKSKKASAAAAADDLGDGVSDQ